MSLVDNGATTAPQSGMKPLLPAGIRVSTPQRTIVAARSGIPAREQLEALRAALSTHGPADETTVVDHPDGELSDLLDEITGTRPTSMGWEVLTLPSSTSARRTVRLPVSITTEFDASAVHPDRLAALHLNSQYYLDDPRLDLAASLVAWRGGELCGWAPVLALTKSTVMARAVLLSEVELAASPARVSVMRLGLFARLLDHVTASGRAVESWIPDDGDPVNDFKHQLVIGAVVTHWMTRLVNRGLTTTMGES